MYTSKYRVVFRDYTEIIVDAGTEQQATILAQAERIKQGKFFDVRFIEFVG